VRALLERLLEVVEGAIPLSQREARGPDVVRRDVAGERLSLQLLEDPAGIRFPARDRKRLRELRPVPGRAAGKLDRLLELLDRVVEANARSRADWKRSPGAFSRQCSMVRESSRGSAGSIPETSGAGSLRMDAIVSADVLRPKALRPEMDSYSTHPSAKMSLVGSACSPRTCSGDM
jgi:hypothetical protein